MYSLISEAHHFRSVSWLSTLGEIKWHGSNVFKAASSGTATTSLLVPTSWSGPQHSLHLSLNTLTWSSASKLKIVALGNHYSSAWVISNSATTVPLSVLFKTKPAIFTFWEGRTRRQVRDGTRVSGSMQWLISITKSRNFAYSSTFECAFLSTLWITQSRAWYLYPFQSRPRFPEVQVVTPSNLSLQCCEVSRTWCQIPCPFKYCLGGQCISSSSILQPLSNYSMQV